MRRVPATEDDDPRRVLGRFIRARRQMANLSLRQLSALTQVSNPYLSQVERGLHQPSVRVLRSIADALDLSVETLLRYAGVSHAAQRADDEPAAPAHEGTTGGRGGEARVVEGRVVEGRVVEGRLVEGRVVEGAVEAAIRADRRLTPAQRRALQGVYRSYLAADAVEQTMP